MTRCPSGKRKRRDFETAAAAAIRLSRRGDPLRPYECPLCGWWHLTKLPLREAS